MSPGHQVTLMRLMNQGSPDTGDCDDTDEHRQEGRETGRPQSSLVKDQLLRFKGKLR